jgi:hypothetical protein
LDAKDEHYITILKVGTEWKLKTRGDSIMTLKPIVEGGRIKYFECLSVQTPPECPQPAFDVRSYDDNDQLESIYGPGDVKYFYTG